MQLSFRPPLADLVHIHAPPCNAPAQVLFTATFASHRDYAEYRRVGARLELWANPDGDDHWASQTFKEWQPLPGSTSPPFLEFSLNAADDPEGFPENTLALWLNVPSSNKDVFEYTFRLVYPSGEVLWMGNAQNNGNVFIDRSNPSVVLHHAWSVQANPACPRALSWQALLTSADDVEIARLAVDIARSCIVWAFGDGRFKRVVYSGFGDSAAPLVRGCSLIIVTPRVHTKTTSVPPVLAISAAPGSSVSVTSHGEFTVSGPGERSLLLQTYDNTSSARAFFDSLHSHAQPSPGAFSFLDCDAQADTIVLASPKNMHPVSILTLSVFPSLFTLSNVNIKIHDLAKLASNPSRLVLFSNTSYQVFIFENISKYSPDVALNLTTDPAGGHLIVAAVHTLDLGNDALWDIAMLSPHVPAVGSDHALPTPPASPALRPFAHLSLQHSITSSSTSISSLKDAEQPVSGPLAGPSSSGSTGSPLSIQRSLTALVTRNINFALELWRLLFNVIFGPFFWLSWVRGRFASSGITARSDNQKKRESESRNAADSAESHSDRSDSHAQYVEVGDIQRPQVGDAQKHMSMPFFADVLGVGNVSIFLQSRSACARIAAITVESNGVAINEFEVEEIGEGKYLLNFDHDVQGGRVKVFSG